MQQKTQPLSGVLSRAGAGALVPSITTALVAALFFLSGVSSLIYEILWMRMFTQVFGSTMAATSTVLAAFMAGLALGSYMIGTYADRHSQNALRIYAYLEVVIGVFGLLMPFFINALYVIYGFLFRNFEGSYVLMNGSRFILSSVLILIPTTMMGATLPVISKHFVFSHRTLCRWVGLLYGINTFGAVAGSFVSGFFLVARLGVTRTIYVAAALNFAVAFFALFLARISSPGEETAEASSESAPEIWSAFDAPAAKRIRNLLLLVCFGAGCSSLAMEVIWTRLLVYIIDSTVYAFCTMLTTFLFGIALGGIVISAVYGRIKNEVRWLGTLNILVGLSGLAVIVIVMNTAVFQLFFHRIIIHAFGVGWWSRNSIKFLMAFSIMLVPTVLLGMAFPLLCKIYTRSIKELGGSIGTVYAVNTFGAVIGSLGAGFVMIPLLGITRSIVMVSGIGLILGLSLLLTGSRRVSVWVFSEGALVLGLCAALFLISPDILSRVYSGSLPNSEMVYYYEGKSGTVTVQKYPGDIRYISVNATDVAGTEFSLRTTQKFQAHAPMLVHGHAKKVLQIGFGSGETSHVVTLYPIERFDLAEIDANVIKTSERFFADINHEVTKDPKFHPIIIDGKNYVSMTDEKYDVILNDSTYPHKSGSSSLYTRDHFMACRRHLNEGGVLTTWTSLDLKPEDFETLVKTFQSVFPYTTVWLARNCLNKHVVIMGTLEPFEIDFDRMAELMSMPAIKADLEEVRLENPFAFLASFVMDPTEARRYSENAPIHSDDHPTLQFSAGRNLTHVSYWALNQEKFLRFQSSVIPFLRFSETHGEKTEAIVEKMMRYERSARHLSRVKLWELIDEVKEGKRYARVLTPERRKELETALQINPDDENARFFLEESDELMRRLEEMALAEPGNARLFYELGCAYRDQERYPEAIAALTRATSLSGNNHRFQKTLQETVARAKKAGTAHPMSAGP
jgi:spermidine synthase